MKKIFTLVFIAFIQLLQAQSPSFKTYMNPVIPGDHPDCTLSKIGNDFYTTGSSFNVTSIIYHSTDLVHWEAVSQPVSASWTGFGDTPGGGCWGGQLVLYNGIYWDFFSRANTMYFVKANNPRGPWTDPVKVNNPPELAYGLGYDNSVFIDEDNKWYLVVKNGQPNNGIVELNSSGQPTGIVYNLDWLNPGPAYSYSWAEGPVMWKYDGFYYYSFARDVSGGQKVMRSLVLTDDSASWEILGDFFNETDPNKSTSLFTSPNHASASVVIADSSSWITHPLYAKGEWKGQGRQGLLNQVRYNSDHRPVADYPVDKPFAAPNLPSNGIPWMVPKSDFFDMQNLNPEWSFLGYTAKTKSSLTDKPGWLRLSPKSTVKATTVLKNDGEHNYSLVTRISFNPKSINDEAGLWIIRGDETKFAKLCSSVSPEGKKMIYFSFDNTKYESENWLGDTLWLKLVRINHKISAYFGTSGKDWVKLGQEIDVSAVDIYSDFSTWAGTRQGLFVKGSTDAYFDLYIYRDAYTPILAECPANQYGTSRSNISGGIHNLDNIHNNDWAMYAGIEFGNGEYYETADSVEFTAASATSGGIVEVWLDSLDTGTKIGECTIASTGSVSKFSTFKAAISSVSGIHDVYLKFTGAGSDKLFLLKWYYFTRSSDHNTSISTVNNQKSLTIYPNPTKDELSLNCDFPFNNIEIFDLNGHLEFANNYAVAKRSTILSLNLIEGIYMVKVRNNEQYAVSRLILE